MVAKKWSQSAKRPRRENIRGQNHEEESKIKILSFKHKRKGKIQREARISRPDQIRA